MLSSLPLSDLHSPYPRKELVNIWILNLNFIGFLQSPAASIHPIRLSPPPTFSSNVKSIQSNVLLQCQLSPPKSSPKPSNCLHPIKYSPPMSSFQPTSNQTTSIKRLPSKALQPLSNPFDLPFHCRYFLSFVPINPSQVYPTVSSRSALFYTNRD